jgi:hypothetical protein
VPFLGIAFALEQLARRQTAVSLLALAGCLCAFGFLDARFFRTVADDGGAPGEYGVAYRYKADAAAMFVRENPGRRFWISAEDDIEPRDYRLLVWNALPRHAEPTRPPVVGYLVGGTVRGIPEDLLPAAVARSYPSARFGPVEVLSVPLTTCRRPVPRTAWICSRLAR